MGEPSAFLAGARAGELAFAAADARGQDGGLGEAGDAAGQAAHALEHLRTTLEALGHDLDHVVSLWVLLTDCGELDAVSRVLDRYFPEPARYPATTFLGVAGLDGGCAVRLDAVATAGAQRSAFRAAGAPLARGARTHGVRAGDLYFLSGIDAGDVAGADAGDTLGRQTTAVLDRMAAVLESQGLALGDVGRTFMFLSDMRVRPAYAAARRARYEGIFALDAFPANSGIGVPDLGSGVMLRSVAIAGPAKRHVASEQVRRSPGSFSQAVRLGDWLFVAGQDAIDLEHRTEAIGDLAGQTERTLGYLRHVVEAAGATLDDVVKTTVYLIAGQDRAQFADTYRQYFGAHTRGGWLPAGLTLDVQQLAADVLVEIDAVAYLGPR
jgi:2-iminobutanoate/2-iminopropanoate deaminase